jgi:hypothetical protein
MKRKRQRVKREPSPRLPLSFFMDDGPQPVTPEQWKFLEQRSSSARILKWTNRMPNRMIGTVAGVNRDRGFFFICGPDGRDYFAFSRDLPGHRSLNTLIAQVTRIRFTARDPEPVKGPAAFDLEILDEVPQPEDPTAKRLGRRERK